MSRGWGICCQPSARFIADDLGATGHIKRSQPTAKVVSSRGSKASGTSHMQWRGSLKCKRRLMIDEGSDRLLKCAGNCHNRLSLSFYVACTYRPALCLHRPDPEARGTGDFAQQAHILQAGEQPFGSVSRETQAPCATISVVAMGLAISTSIIAAGLRLLIDAVAA